MADSRNIVFVGPGVMAEAIVGGLIQRAGVPASDIGVAGPRPERLQEFKDRHGVRVDPDSRSAVAGASTVVLAVKPQTLDDVMR
ncbi:MAG: proC, partial [Anaerolineales bacterium]|nr:proC [Anaerolineales bacterium]